MYICLYTPHEQCVVFALLFLLHKTIYQDCSVNGVLPHTKQWVLTTAETSLSLLRCLAYQTSPNFTRSPQKPASVITHPTNHILVTALGTFRAPKSIHLTCPSVTFLTFVEPLASNVTKVAGVSIY